MKYNPRVWFSLRFGIYYFWSVRKKFKNQSLTHQKFQKEREAWIVSAALLGITKVTQKLWWIQIPEDDPPDMLTMTLTPQESNDLNFIDYRLVEVSEITKYTNKKIVDEILQKLKGKYYEKETCLVVYLRRDIKIEDMQKLSEELKNSVINVADIWILGNIKPGTNDFILFSLYPEVQTITYNLDEEISRLPPGDIIELTRSKGTKMILVKDVIIPKFNPKR